MYSGSATPPSLPRKIALFESNSDSVPQDPSRQFAALDLGSNSFHMVVAREGDTWRLM